MKLAIIKKVEGRWIVDTDSTYIFESSGGAFSDGTYQEIEVARITPIARHPKEPIKSES